jgi:hypothetical protein
MNNDMIDKYFEVLMKEAEQSGQTAKYAYVSGVLMTQLRWALGSEREREIVRDTIMEAVQ